MLSGDMIKEHVEVGIQFNIPCQKNSVDTISRFFSGGTVIKMSE